MGMDRPPKITFGEMCAPKAHNSGAASRPLVQAFNNPNVAHSAIAKRLERFAVSRTAICSDCLLQTWIFDDDDAFFQTLFKCYRCVATSQEVGPKRCNRRGRELGIGSFIRSPRRRG